MEVSVGHLPILSDRSVIMQAESGSRVSLKWRTDRSHQKSVHSSVPVLQCDKTW
jgi:hypothetical protein